MPALYPIVRIAATSSIANIPASAIKKRKYPLCGIVGRSNLSILAGRNRVPVLAPMFSIGKAVAKPRMIARPRVSIKGVSRLTLAQIARASTIAPPTGDIKIDGNLKLSGARIVQGSTVNLFFSLLGERLGELDILLRISTLAGDAILTKSLSGKSLLVDSTTEQPQGKTLLVGSGNLFAHDTRRLEKEIELSYEFWALNSVISRQHLIETGTFTLYQP